MRQTEGSWEIFQQKVVDFRKIRLTFFRSFLRCPNFWVDNNGPRLWDQRVSKKVQIYESRRKMSYSFNRRPRVLCSVKRATCPPFIHKEHARIVPSTQSWISCISDEQRVGKGRIYIGFPARTSTSLFSLTWLTPSCFFEHSAVNGWPCLFLPKAHISGALGSLTATKRVKKKKVQMCSKTRSKSVLYLVLRPGGHGLPQS